MRKPGMLVTGRNEALTELISLQTDGLFTSSNRTHASSIYTKHLDFLQHNTKHAYYINIKRINIIRKLVSPFGIGLV